MLLRAAAALSLFAVVSAAQKLDCAACHTQAASLAKSAHASLSCTDCHSGIKRFPHKAGAPKPQCGDCHPAAVQQYEAGAHGIAARQGNDAAPDCEACHGNVHDLMRVNAPEFLKSVPEICGNCHPDPARDYLESIHGKAYESGNFDAPSCPDCHGAHTIVPLRSPVSLANPARIRDTCASCHANIRLSSRYKIPLGRVESFNNTFHGLALKAGSLAVANCASCHGIHLILPSSDPRSSVNPANLSATCGKCHPGAGSRFAIGTIHVLPGQEPFAVQLVRNAYLFIIPFLIGYMAVHHGGDLIHKLARLRLRRVPMGPYPALRPEPGAEVRMHRAERMEHMALLVSFTVLAWSGFALIYPDSWWAWIFTVWEPVFPVRGTVHRVAAVVIVGVAVTHAVSLVADRRLRRHWKTLWPRRKDVPELVWNTGYNIGVVKEKPLLSSHSYIEKIEYWAVVWGTAAMAITGFVLWFNRYTLAYLPKLWLDVSVTIHLYEATLAALAILVWHFYMVIFDPEVYPMDPAWIHGVSVRRRIREAREEEDQPPEPGATPE